MRRLEQSAVHAEPTARVITWLCARMQAATLRPGDPIPSAAELAGAARVGNRHVRAAVACLRALGILRRRTDSAVVLAEDSSPVLLDLLAARYAASGNATREALRILAIQLAGLAAQRATLDDHTAMAEEVAEMYAAGTTGEHLEHVVRFHRAIARAAGNSVLAAFAEVLMVSNSNHSQALVEASFDLRESARMHSEIYRAIRRRHPAEAKNAMEEHGYLAAQSLPVQPCPEEDQAISQRTGT